MSFVTFLDELARALSLCFSSLGEEGIGPLRTNLAWECVIALAQDCDGLK